MRNACAERIKVSKAAAEKALQTAVLTSAYLQEQSDQVSALFANHMLAVLIKHKLNIAVQDALKDLLWGISIEWWSTCISTDRTTTDDYNPTINTVRMTA